MEPLAYQMRPKTLEDIVGQEHLIGNNGIIKKMIDKKHIFSFILYGNPGCGKTTIAEATAKASGMPYYRFNASTDAKDNLKQILTEAKFNENTIIIVDEIHRMKKDIQDFLLPSVENGMLTLIGLTTVSPYHSVNPAIRSRCNIYRLNDLTHDDLMKILERAKGLIALDKDIDEEVYDYLIAVSNFEIRSLINSFETLVVTSTSNHITLEDAKQVCQKPNISIDANGDSYYDTLSGLHKSIRGSDVDASLHYLAKLIAVDDLVSLTRRLKCIAYEDIGLANPGIGPRVNAACDAALTLGNPEARLPLSVVVIEMALSPKSNSAYLAIDAAQKDIEAGNTGNIPLNLKNQYSFDPKQEAYKYPHEYPNSWVDQQYMPTPLLGKKYYIPKPTSMSETSLYNRYMEIEGFKKQAKENKNIKH